LILTDLFRPMTTNAGMNALLAKKGGVAVVSGVNLPKLLELIPALKACKSVDESTKLALKLEEKP